MSIDSFDKICKNIDTSYLKVGDESKSVISFWTTAKGNLPHLSYIICKPEPMGMEFKNVDCLVTESLIFIEIQIGK